MRFVLGLIQTQVHVARALVRKEELFALLLSSFGFKFVIQQNELIARQSSQLANVEWFRATKFAYKYVQR